MTGTEQDPRAIPRNAVATPIGESAVLVVMRRGERGPWSILTDVPRPGRELLGPPPGYLALVGIASCTIVTVAGVASRGESPLLGMQVRFTVREGQPGGATIEQHTTFEGHPSERDYGRFSRAVAHCPVGKNFTKRGVDIVDVVRVAGGAGAAGDAGADGGAGATGDGAGNGVADTDGVPVFAPGEVVADYLIDTQEWREKDGRLVLDEEGEVDAHVTLRLPGRVQRWGLLGGHSSAGWAPRPSSYALAALAASTVMTLRSLAGPLAIDPATVRVDVSVASELPSGGKRESQEAAAVGVAQRVAWRREVTVEAVSGACSEHAIRRVIEGDPIYGYCLRGDLLADDTVEVVAPRTRLVAPAPA